MLPLNTTIRERYRITHAVDERPNGQVYQAHDEQTDRQVLLAAVPLAGKDAAEAEALVRQLAATRHDRLVPIDEHFAADQTYYLVSEASNGQTLLNILRARGGPLPETMVLEQSRGLLDLLDGLHSQRPPLYLGELWPNDLWVNDAGDWLLLPSTLLRALDQTPVPYRAPELQSADAEPTATSDMYAVSALMYHALSGYPPATPAQQTAGTPLVAPRTLNPALSSLAEQALLRGLQLKRENRYQTAREVWRALDTVQMMIGRSLGAAIPNTPPPPPNVAQGAILPSQPQTAPIPNAPAAPVMAPAGQPAAVPDPHNGFAGDAIPGSPPRRGLSTGCLIALVTGLVVFVVLLCLGLAVLALSLFGSRAVVPSGSRTAATATSVPGGGASAPTSGGIAAGGAPAPQTGSAQAISLQNAAQITATKTITSPTVGAAIFSPDGKTMAVGSGTAISIRASDTLEEARRLNGAAGDIGALAWSPNGKLIAAGNQDEPTVRVWDAATGQLLHAMQGPAGWTRSLAFSPDNTLLASGGSGAAIVLWSMADGSRVRQLSGHTDYIGGIAFSPDGKTLASASRDGTVRLWDVANGQPRSGFSFQTPVEAATNKPYWATGIAWSPDGRQLAVGAIDGVVRLLDPATGTVQRELRGHTTWVIIRGVVYMPDGKTLLSEDLDGKIMQWNLASGTAIGQFTGHRVGALGMALSADGKQLASTSPEEGLLLVWNVANPAQPDRTLRIGQGLITSLSYARDASLIAAVGYNGIVKIANPSDGSGPLLVGSSISPQPVAFLPDKQLVVISDEGTVGVLGTQQEPKQLTGLQGPPVSVATSQNNATIAVGTISGTVSLWNNDAPAATKTITSGLPAATTLAINGDDTLLAVAGPVSDPRVAVLSLANGEAQHVFSGSQGGITSMAFQPRGALLAASDAAGALRVWNAQTGDIVRTVQASPDQQHFSGVAWSPDGSIIAAGTRNGELVLWNAQTGDQIATVPTPGSVLALAWSPNGDQIALSTRNDAAALYIYSLPS